MDLYGERFSASEGTDVGYFDAVVDIKNKKEEVHFGEITSAEIPRWLQRENPAPAHKSGPLEPASFGRIRVLRFPRGQRPFQLSITDYVWTQVSTAFSLHTSTPEVFLDNNGAFVAYYPSSPGGSQCHEARYIMKVPRKRQIGYHALSLSYSPQSRTLFALIHGVEKRDWDEILAQLRNHIHLAMHPLLLPFLIFSNYRLNSESFRWDIDSNILDTEQETGYGIPSQMLDRTFKLHTNSDSSDPLDFGSILRRLYSHQTQLSALTTVAGFNIDYGNFLVEHVEKVEKLYPEIASDGKKILQMLELPRSQSHTAMAQIQSLKERVQSQINLIFGLSSQNENKISRQVAEESAKIALATRRDGTAMKTIALMTMLFLPATFVAAFLSMPFFNWRPDEGEINQVSSRFLWVYWVITLPLTLVIFLGWWGWWKLEENKSWLEIERLKVKQA